MPLQQEYDSLYMDIAFRVSLMSKAVRLKVGSIVVQGNSIVSYGYNGTPKGFDNTAEYPDAEGKLVTKPEVVHSELNSLLKLIKTNIPVKDGIMFCTHAPCLACSVHIYQSEVIKEVVYSEEYRSRDGLDFLIKNGIKVRQFITKS
jgi:dCMP deaminase